MASFECVGFGSLSEEGKIKNKLNGVLKLNLRSEFEKNHIDITNDSKVVQTFELTKSVHTAKLGVSSLVMTVEDESYIINFKNVKAAQAFEKQVKAVASQNEVSIFTQRTDPSSAEQYFQFYGYMSQQQNMMQDYIRTSTYQCAMLNNIADFQDKVVLDVGAGSGILSFFAIQAGAKKVYAIEASSMAKHCQNLVNSNKLSNEIIVIAGKIEEVQLKEKVDVIISEPMGYMLFNERMLETFLHAKKWLKPGGKMYPTQGDLHVAPFTDEALYMEQCSKANFWYQNSFHSVDLSSLRETALLEYFRQPIVDTFDIRICLARSVKHTVNFLTAHESDLHNISIPISFHLLHSGTIHGLAFWFDVAFLGSQNAVWLSTAPTQPLTHWYQVRCLLQTPIFAKQGQNLVGKVVLKSNKRQSYDVDISLGIPGTSIKSSNTLDLKNPFFRYTGQAVMPPPGTNTTSPSDNYWNQQDMAQNNAYGGSMLNGGIGDGLQMNQQGALYNNLGNIACANIGHPASSHNLSRTSIGAGISPALFNQSLNASGGVVLGQQQQQQQQQGSNMNHYMIGDYMVQQSNNNFMPANLSLLNFKGQ